MDVLKKSKTITIPNILSLARILLIPIIAWAYYHGYNHHAVGILILSGVTDVVDGFIARKFNMTSDLGKILDPVADKLTQAVTLFCLIKKFPFMLAPFLVLVVKEIFLSIQGLVVVKKTNEVKSANWHGKITTFLLYFTMCLHILWVNIPPIASNLTIGACLAFMLLSFVLYIIRNVKQLKNKKTAAILK